MLCPSSHEVIGHSEDGGEDGDACDDVLLLPAVQDVLYPGAEPPAAGTGGLASHHSRRRRLYAVGSWCVRLGGGLRLELNEWCLRPCWGVFSPQIGSWSIFCVSFSVQRTR